MSLKSMTGFGRAEGRFQDWSWVWEVRAVNGKSLDVRMRLPNGYESLEPRIRKHVSGAVHRGNLQISLTVNTSGVDTPFRVNTDWLKTLVASATAVSEARDLKPPKIEALYAVKGVVEDCAVNVDDPKYAERNTHLHKSLEDLTASLNQARASEGEDLTQIISHNIQEMAQQVARARTCAGDMATIIQQKFAKKFEELLGEKLPQDKLVQEASILAVKADVREELDRLDAHVKQAQNLINTGSPIGRKLGFLSQEILREVNTLCSKSMDIELTNIGLELKSLIEQFREQSANVE